MVSVAVDGGVRCGIVGFAAVVGKSDMPVKVRVSGTGVFAASVVPGSCATPACGGVSDSPRAMVFVVVPVVVRGMVCILLLGGGFGGCFVVMGG